MKLWFTTANGPQQRRCGEIGSPEGEKMPTYRKWGLSLSVLILRGEGLSPFYLCAEVGRFYE
jgi:hypothetical protein